MLFSVIMTLREGAGDLDASIMSIIRQTTSEWELIVVDASNDEPTHNSCRDWCAADKRVRVLRVEGEIDAGSAKNLGIRHATGPAVAYLGPDDEFYPTYLETIGSHLTRADEDGVKPCFLFLRQLREELGREKQKTKVDPQDAWEKQKTKVDPQDVFAGMEYDSTTGLYYDHARYYDAAIGRFMSQDPKSFSGGDTNLYRYVGNAPTVGVDPSGLQQGQGPGLGIMITVPLPGQGGSPPDISIRPNYTWNNWPGGSIAPFWTRQRGGGWIFGGPGLTPASPDQSPLWPYPNPGPTIGPDPITGRWPPLFTPLVPTPSPDLPITPFYRRPGHILGPNPWWSWPYRVLTGKRS